MNRTDRRRAAREAREARDRAHESGLALRLSVLQAAGIKANEKGETVCDADHAAEIIPRYVRVRAAVAEVVDSLMQVVAPTQVLKASFDPVAARELARASRALAAKLDAYSDAFDELKGTVDRLRAGTTP